MMRGRSSGTPRWGPAHQRPYDTSRRTVKRIVVVVVCLWLAFRAPGWLLTIGALGAVIWRVGPRLWESLSGWGERRRLDSGHPRDWPRARAQLGGAYLGRDRHGRARFSAVEHAVLLLGPPRSGKTSGVIIPTLLAHTGAAVCTSTKADVVAATAGARARGGQVWEFDPTGDTGSKGVRRLRWSPVTSALSWDGALVMARAMVHGARVGAGASDSTHWAKRASALLAAVLHAAALDGQGIEVVCGWVTRRNLDEPGSILERAEAGSACSVLAGLVNTETRERSSICSAALDALDAYTSDAALRAARDPNFDAEAFVRSQDTVYIHAPAEEQALAAPLICGLLSEIRRATYAAARAGQLAGRVLWALDEAANIAPLDELPAVASEGSGQGLRLLASFQDLSQARARWGPQADGFLTLFGTKLLLAGIADPATLEAVSVALGEYDRRMVSHNRQPNLASGLPFPLMTGGHTISTHLQRVLSPGEIANLPVGHALHLDGVRWQLLELTPAHQCEPWRSLISQTPSTPVGVSQEPLR